MYIPTHIYFINSEERPSFLLPARRFACVLLGFAQTFFILFSLSGQDIYSYIYRYTYVYVYRDIDIDIDICTYTYVKFFFG